MIFSAALVALPFLAQVFAKDCTRKYTVQAGDICDSISAARNVSTYQLSAINTGIINEECTNLVPGSQLCLGYTGEDCSTTYTVASGDTCEDVAANHRLNTTVLYANNPQIDDECSNIYVGEVLCVSDKVQVPPTPAGPLPGAAVPTTAAPADPTKYASHSSSHPKPTQPAQDNEDDDDDDLPYCDEL